MLERSTSNLNSWPVETGDIDILLEYFPFLGERKNLTEYMYPWEILTLLQNKLRNLNVEKIKSTNISPRAHIEGPVLIEEGVQILPFAVIKGPAIIGRNSLIGNFAIVRSSVVGPNSIVGSGVEMARSVCLEDCEFHRDYIGDSFLASNVKVGGDSAMSNLRLDRKTIRSAVGNEKVDTSLITFGSIIGSKSRIGGKVLVMPGVKIGQNCIIGPNVTLYNDIADNSKVTSAQTLEITKISRNE